MMWSNATSRNDSYGCRPPRGSTEPEVSARWRQRAVSHRSIPATSSVLSRSGFCLCERSSSSHSTSSLRCDTTLPSTNAPDLYIDDFGVYRRDICLGEILSQSQQLRPRFFSRVRPNHDLPPFSPVSYSLIAVGDVFEFICRPRVLTQTVLLSLQPRSRAYGPLSWSIIPYQVWRCYQVSQPIHS